MTRACPRGWRRTGRAPEPEPLLEPPSGCGAARGLAEPAPDRIDRHAVRRQLKRPRDLTDHFRVVLVPIATQAQRCLHADHMHDDATPCSDAEIFVLHRRRHNRTDVHVCKTGLAAVGLDKLPCCLLELLRHDVVVFHECLEVDSAHRASVQERDLTTGLWISCEEAPQRIEGVEHDHDLGCSVGHSPSDAPSIKACIESPAISLRSSSLNWALSLTALSCHSRPFAKAVPFGREVPQTAKSVVSMLTMSLAKLSVSCEESPRAHPATCAKFSAKLSASPGNTPHHPPEM
mmetsp:Transcript_10354/g.32318  ORF Transcript_10354/g.32318 Transcript_10354/m.32318 type:complete len:290 (-) Transcript_10354:45-914(-)